MTTYLVQTIDFQAAKPNVTKSGIFMYLGQSAAPPTLPLATRPASGQMWPRGINSHG